MSQVGPFYPIEAYEKGVSEYLLGFIISMNPIFYILASIIMAKQLKNVGRMSALRVGLLLICSQLLTLGLINWIENVGLFVFLSMLAQAMGGFGAGTNTTVCFSLIATFFPQEKQEMIGFMEVGIGIGILVGPLMGTLFYGLGGYVCPFWTLGFAFMFMFPVISKLKQFIEAEEEANRSANQSSLLDDESSS